MVDRAGNVAKAKKTTATRKTKAGTSKGVKKAKAKKAAPKAPSKAKTASRPQPPLQMVMREGNPTSTIRFEKTFDVATLTDDAILKAVVACIEEAAKDDLESNPEVYSDDADADVENLINDLDLHEDILPTYLGMKTTTAALLRDIANEKGFVRTANVLVKLGMPYDRNEGTHQVAKQHAPELRKRLLKLSKQDGMKRPAVEFIVEQP